MTPSRRSVIHPPVLSTQEHAETEAAFLNRSHGRPHKDIGTAKSVPKSPATLWATESAHRYTATRIDCVPARLAAWVAPVIEVQLHD